MKNGKNHLTGAKWQRKLRVNHVSHPNERTEKVESLPSNYASFQVGAPTQNGAFLCRPNCQAKGWRKKENRGEKSPRKRPFKFVMRGRQIFVDQMATVAGLKTPGGRKEKSYSSLWDPEACLVLAFPVQAITMPFPRTPTPESWRELGQ